MLSIQTHKKLEKYFKGYNPEHFISDILDPNLIEYKIKEIFEFYNIEMAITHFQIRFSPKLKGVPISKRVSDYYPGWSGVISLHFFKEASEVFSTNRSDLSWANVFTWLFPGVRYSEVKSDKTNARFSVSIFARDFPQIKTYFKEKDPVAIISNGMYRQVSVEKFWTNWKRSRLPGLLMTHADAGALLIKKSKTVGEQRTLNVFKEEAKTWDEKHINHHISKIDKMTNVNPNELDEVAEFLRVNMIRWSVPVDWRLKNDRNIY
tara:strand:+ start:1542 stop:2330 length:789 start_codon:yes stop_codon:yes gene_type:complete